MSREGSGLRIQPPPQPAHRYDAIKTSCQMVLLTSDSHVVLTVLALPLSGLSQPLTLNMRGCRAEVLKDPKEREPGLWGSSIFLDPLRVWVVTFHLIASAWHAGFSSTAACSNMDF